MASYRSLSVNRTIDDEYGDSVSGLRPQYSPPEAWQQGSTCLACAVRLNSSHTFDGTWHDTTYHPLAARSKFPEGNSVPRTMTVRFNGTAVYVYNILANSVFEADTFTNITFSMDGPQVGQFSHIPTASGLYEYNVLVYMNDSLPNCEHELVIQAGDSSPSLILFDYIEYTFTDESAHVSSSTMSTIGIATPPNIETRSASPSSEQTTQSTSVSPSNYTQHRSHTDAIIIGTVGSVSGLALLAMLLFIVRTYTPRSRSRGVEETRGGHRRTALGENPPSMVSGAHIVEPTRPMVASSPQVPSSGQVADVDALLQRSSDPVHALASPLVPSPASRRSSSATTWDGKDAGESDYSLRPAPGHHLYGQSESGF